MNDDVEEDAGEDGGGDAGEDIWDDGGGDAGGELERKIEERLPYRSLYCIPCNSFRRIPDSTARRLSIPNPAVGAALAQSLYSSILRVNYSAD